MAYDKKNLVPQNEIVTYYVQVTQVVCLKKLKITILEWL